MKLILIPLFFLILLAVTVQMVNFNTIDYSTSSGNSDINTVQGSTNQQLQLNSLNSSNVSFNLTLMTGFLALFAVCIGAGILSGLNISIFGSTVQISERAQNLLYNSLFYGGLWGIFSVLATVGINGFGLFAFPVWGALFYLILTLLYVLGVNNQIQHGLEG